MEGHIIFASASSVMRAFELERKRGLAVSPINYSDSIVKLLVVPRTINRPLDVQIQICSKKPSPIGGAAA